MLIQSAWRGYRVRKRLNEELKAVCIIQHWWRGRMIRDDWLKKREVSDFFFCDDTILSTYDVSVW
jgi:hypothetical protein